MQFNDALLAARRLAADGKGAEDHVIIAALIDRILWLEHHLADLIKECNLRHDGVLVLSETMKSHVRVTRNRLCQIDGMMDAHEAQIFDLRKSVPKKTKKPKVEDDTSAE